MKAGIRLCAKGIRIGLCVLGLLMMTVPIARAVTLSAAADGWNVTNQEGNVVYTMSDDGVLTVSFAAQSATAIPVNSEMTVNADVGVGEGSFVGDYMAGGVKGLSFRIARGGAGKTDVYLRLLCRVNGKIHQWDNFGLTLDGPGVWTVKNLPFTMAAGWFRQGGSEGSLRVALSDVVLLSVKMIQRSADAESVSIDDFRLVGDGFVSEQAVLQRLQNVFGADISNVDQLTQAQRSKDSNRDGKTDVEAVVEGEEPGVEVRIVSVDADGITVSWNSEKTRHFTLRRVDNLKAGFENGTILLQKVDDVGGEMTYRDTTAVGTGPYSYRVTKD